MVGLRWLLSLLRTCQPCDAQSTGPAQVCELFDNGAKNDAACLAIILMKDWPGMEDMLKSSLTTRVSPDELDGRASALMPARAPRTIVTDSDTLEFFDPGEQDYLSRGTDGEYR